MTPAEAREVIKVIQSVTGAGVDGEWGPLSKAALDRVIRISLEYEPSAPAVVKHPFIAVAAEWVGIKETSRNHFSGMERVWADTSYPDGYVKREPYCAAFQCYVVAEAKRRGAKPYALPKSASVREFRAWGRNLGYAVSAPKPGDHFTLLPSGTSHIGLVESVDESAGLIHSIEANTGASGERDGDGFWRKTRRIASCDFLRIPVS